MKKILKPIYVLLLKCCLFLLYPVVLKKINIPLEKATRILNDFSPDSHGNVEANNKITPKYDLHIIIPCYNVEKYVVNCLESVFSQETNFSYFVTIINDGSTDNTLQLIQEYISKLSSEKQQIVKFINQENKGLPSARNVGLRHIVGKYVMFIDSDDMLLPNAIQKMLTTAFEKQVDIVVGGHIIIDQYSNFVSNVAGSFNIFAWGKIFKSEIFRNLKFQEYLFEDVLVICCIYPKYNNKILIEDNVYQHRKHNNSIMANYKINKKTIDVFYLYPYIFRYMVSKKFFLPDRICLHIIFTYNATKNFDTEIKYAGFSILCNCIEEIIKEYPKSTLERITYKQKWLLNALLQKDFAKYNLISKYWWYFL